MKKILTKMLSVCFAISFVGMTACGGGNNSGGGSGSQNDVVTIKIGDMVSSTTGLDGLTYNRQQAFSAANPNIKVIHVDPVVSDSTKTTQEIVEEINTDDACTLMSTTAPNYARSLYQMGLIEDFKKYMTDEEIYDLNPNIVEMLTSSSGAMTGYPTTLETPLIGFNRKHLRSEYVRKQFLGDNYNADNALELIEAEIDNVKTWDDYKKVLEKLTGNYVVDFVQTDVSGYGGYYTDYYLGIGIWLISNGYGITSQNADNTIEVNLNEKTTIETINYLQGLAQDGIAKLNTSIGFLEFYNQIFQNKVASFIYYPAWSSWFQQNAMYADDIKVINMPYGPSVEARIEAGETVVATNASFANTWVMNKNATDAQKKAAVKYLTYMYGYEAVEQKYDYILENNIEIFSLPALRLEEEYINDTILAIAPEDWREKILTSMNNLFILRTDTDVWRTYISSDVPTLLKKDSNYLGDKLTERLVFLTNRIKTEWLDFYNNKVTG